MYLEELSEQGTNRLGGSEHPPAVTSHLASWASSVLGLPGMWSSRALPAANILNVFYDFRKY